MLMELDKIILKKLWNGDKVLYPKYKEVFRTINIINIILKNNK